MRIFITSLLLAIFTVNLPYWLDKDFNSASNWSITTNVLVMWGFLFIVIKTLTYIDKVINRK